MWPVDPLHQHNALAMPFHLAVALIMGIALIVGVLTLLTPCTVNAVTAQHSFLEIAAGF